MAVLIMILLDLLDTSLRETNTQRVHLTPWELKEVTVRVIGIYIFL